MNNSKFKNKNSKRTIQNEKNVHAHRHALIFRSEIRNQRRLCSAFLLTRGPRQVLLRFDLTNFSVKLHREILHTYFDFFFSGPSFRRNEFLKMLLHAYGLNYDRLRARVRCDFQKFVLRE